MAGTIAKLAIEEHGGVNRAAVSDAVSDIRELARHASKKMGKGERFSPTDGSMDDLKAALKDLQMVSEVAKDIIEDENEGFTSTNTNTNSNSNCLNKPFKPFPKRLSRALGIAGN
jgi:hypothetical protein